MCEALLMAAGAVYASTCTEKVTFSRVLGACCVAVSV